MLHSRHDPAQLALSLLGDMPPAERAEFLSNQLINIADLRLLITARNMLTEAVDSLI